MENQKIIKVYKTIKMSDKAKLGKKYYENRANLNITKEIQSCIDSYLHYECEILALHKKEQDMFENE